MRRADRLTHLPASLAALALVVPLALVGARRTRVRGARRPRAHRHRDGGPVPVRRRRHVPAGRGDRRRPGHPVGERQRTGRGRPVHRVGPGRPRRDGLRRPRRAGVGGGVRGGVRRAGGDDGARRPGVVDHGAHRGGRRRRHRRRHVRARPTRATCASQMNQRTSFTWDPARLHWYGYSLFSLEVYGTPTQVAAAFATGSTTVPAGPDATVPVILATAAGDRHDRPRAVAPAARAWPARTTPRSTRCVTLPGRRHRGERHRADRRPRPARPGAHGRADAVGAVDGPGPRRPHHQHRHHHPARRPARRRRGHRARRLRVRRPRRVHHVGHQRAGDPGAVDRARWTAAAAASSPPSSGTPAAGDWFGFTHDIAATDWSAHDGFTFWFLGTGGGGLLRYELKSNGQLFERSVTDDTAGWRQVNVAFSQLRLKGNPASDARFDPSASTGFAVTLTDLGAGAWTFDDLGLYDRVTTIEDAEGDVPIAAPGSTVGHLHVGLGRPTWSAWASRSRTATARPPATTCSPATTSSRRAGTAGSARTSPPARTGARSAASGWPGTPRSRPARPARRRAATSRSSSRTAAPTASTPSCGRPRSRTTGRRDGSRWNVVDLPFSARSRSSGYQPGDAATRNGTLDLTSAWGYALTMVPGTADVGRLGRRRRAAVRLGGPRADGDGRPRRATSCSSTRARPPRSRSCSPPPTVSR